MPGRYAKLKKDWMLRGWSDVHCAVVNWTNGDQRKLKKNGAYTARACDGKTDLSSIAFLPSHNALLDKMIEEGIAQECEPGDSIAPYQQYRKAANPCLNGLHWSITGLCNLNCRHCCMEAPSGRYGQLSFADTLRVIVEFERANVQQVSLTGGEPLLRKDLLEIMAALARVRISAGRIYTNALLVTEEILEGIKQTGFSPSFQISFDGVGAHDYMRGQNRIEQGTIEGIRKVQAAGFPVVVATSVDRVSKDSLAETYDLLRDLEIRSWRIAPPQETGNWRGAATGVTLEEEAAVYEPIMRRWIGDGKPFSIQLGALFNGTGREKPASEEIPVAHHTSESYDCAACREEPYLLPDGTLLPCAGYVDTVVQERMPNILREGLPSALRHSFLRSITDRKKGELLANNPECAACELFEQCGMGCRAAAVVKTGDLMAKDTVCCETLKKGYTKRFTELADAVE